MRPPSSFSGPPIKEWRYTIPLAPAVPPARAATSSAPNAVPPRVAPVNRAPEPMPEPLFPLAHSEPVFGAITLSNDFVPEYFLSLVLPSNVLAARFLARISIHDLFIGLAVLVLGFAAGIVSAATLQAPVAAYLSRPMDQRTRCWHTLPMLWERTTFPSYSRSCLPLLRITPRWSF
jgi:hypothetical protein